MPNPFENLGSPKLKNPAGEKITGSFSCNECYKQVSEAVWIEEVKRITWICEEGHLNEVPFNFD